jgi:magnesium transporter
MNRDQAKIDAAIAEAAANPALAPKVLPDWHVADIVEAIARLPRESAIAILRELPEETAIRIFNTPGLDQPSHLLEALPEARAVRILNSVHPDRRAELLRGLPAGLRDGLLHRLEERAKAPVEKILAYPADKAGGIMTTDFISVPEGERVKEVIQRIRTAGPAAQQIYAVYVVEAKSGRLLQAVSVRELLIADPEAPIRSTSPRRRPVAIGPGTDREEVARLISKYDLLAVPVVNGEDRILGIVTVDDVIDAIVAESSEDVQKFGGMEAIGGPYLKTGFLTMIKKRAGWLAALFISEMLTASAMQHYSSELEKAVVLTLFIPLIMSSGGNSGSQATSLMIRSLALHELKLGDWWRVARREIPAGLALGAILAVIGMTRIFLWQKAGFYNYGEHWSLVAATVGAALIGIVTFGSLAGSMLPFILQRLRLDPASASAPLVATLVDVTGLVIYFSIAMAILKGTLL